MEEGKYTNFSKAEQYVFDYLVTLNFTKEKFTIEQIANGSCSSQSTVLRTLKKMGYKNFSEFKYERIYLKGVEVKNNAFILKEEEIEYNLSKLELKLNKIMNERAVVLLLDNTASFYFTLLYFESLKIEVITINDIDQLYLLTNITYFSLSIDDLFMEKSIIDNLLIKVENTSLLEMEYLKINILYKLFTSKRHFISN